MKSKLLLASVLSALGLICSLPVSFVVLIFLWLFVYGEGYWPDVYGVDMISFVIALCAAFFSLVGFAFGLLVLRIGKLFSVNKHK